MCLTLILHWVSADPAGFRYCPPPSPMHWLPVNSRDIADIQRLNSRDSSLDCSLMNPRRDLGPKHCSLCGKVRLFVSKKIEKSQTMLYSYVTLTTTNETLKLIVFRPFLEDLFKIQIHSLTSSSSP